MITIKFNGKNALDEFKRKELRAMDLTPVMDVIAQKGYTKVIEHFAKEEGPNGKWGKWRKTLPNGSVRIYNERPTKRGGTKLLQDTGRLRESIVARGYKKSAEIFAEPSNYAGTNYSSWLDKGTKKMIARKFMWLRSEDRAQYSEDILKYITGGTS